MHTGLYLPGIRNVANDCVRPKDISKFIFFSREIYVSQKRDLHNATMSLSLKTEWIMAINRKYVNERFKSDLEKRWLEKLQ